MTNSSVATTCTGRHDWPACSPTPLPPGLLALCVYSYPAHRIDRFTYRWL